MKSIERLRDIIDGSTYVMVELVDSYIGDAKIVDNDAIKNALGVALDEMEDELAREYVELPKDKDGIPIRPDDEIVVHHPGMEPQYSTVTALILTDRWDFEQSCCETDS